MKNLILLLLLFFLSLSQARAQNWRVVYIVNNTYQDTGSGNKAYFPIDSLAYLYDYQSARGSSAPLNDSVEYDRQEWYVKDTVLSKKYNKEVLLTRSYYNDNTLRTQSYTYRNFNIPCSVGAVDTFYYLNGLPTSKYNFRCDGSAQKMIRQDKDDYIRNANGDIVHIIRWFFDANTNTYDTFQLDYYDYDAKGNLTKDSIVGYDQANNTWMTTRNVIYTYSYNTAGRVIQKSFYSKGPSTPQYVLTSDNYYSYNSNGKVEIDSHVNRYTGTHAPGPEVHIYSYNGQGLLFTDTLKKYNKQDSLLSYQVKKYTYTSFGYVKEREDGVSTLPHFYYRKVRYGYEHYWPLDVPNESQGPPRNTGLSLSPIPASNVLQIYWHYADAEDVQGRIIDMNGRTLLQWEEKAKPYYGAYWYSKKIDIANLASGNYYLVLHTRVGTYHKQFVVVK